MARVAVGLALGALLSAVTAAIAAASFSGENGLIAYAAKAGKRASESSIFTMTSQGRSPEQLTTSAIDHNPAWSPRGDMIAFDRQPLGHGRRRVYLMNDDGSDQRPLPMGRRQSFNPTWSPDGRALAFESCGRHASCKAPSIFTVRSNGRRLKRVVDTGIDPVWAPTGDWIAYQGRLDAGECLTLVLVRPSGGERRAVLPREPDPQGICSWGGAGADFSPDGRHLVYLGLRDAGGHLYDPAMYSVAADGTDRRLLRFRSVLTVGAFETPFVWSPDGHKLLWRDESGTYVGNTRAAEPRQVGHSLSTEHSWQSLG